MRNKRDYGLKFWGFGKKFKVGTFFKRWSSNRGYKLHGYKGHISFWRVRTK